MAASGTAEKYDRSYLEGMIDLYIEAMIAHDPDRVPLARNVKLTENGQDIPVGEGLWATASAKASYKLYVCDPGTGQVGFFGLMQENGRPILISLGLKIENKLITEIETIVVRQDDNPWPFNNLNKPHPVYLEALKPEERIPREEMVRITDLYFDGLVQDNGDMIPFDAECNRIENGIQTTNNPSIGMPGTSGSTPPPALGPAQQINAKVFSYITGITPRRYTVVDEERGITFGTFMFQHKGTVESRIAAARRPFTVIVSELFKIKSNKIRQIEVIMTEVPYQAGSGWDILVRSDRAHLEGLIDQYFTALTTHDPQRLPLSPTVKCTENTAEVQPGDGLWATASSLPSYKHVFTDIIQGQAGCFAVLKENDSPILIAVRLKERNKLISEIESIIVRPREGNPTAWKSLTKPNPIFAEVLTPGERSSRREMQAMADLYFDGLEKDTGEYVKFADDCHRMENGMITANNPNPGPDQMGAMTAMKCIDQFKMKTFYFITRINPRRYLLFDEERGLVLCNAMFLHAGNILEAEIPGRGMVKSPAFALKPSSVQVSELFKIKNGKIQEIEVVGTTFPYGIKTGWE